MTSASLTPSQITDALRAVVYPGLTRDLVSFGMVQRVSVCDGRVKISLAVRTRDDSIPARLELEVLGIVENMSGPFGRGAAQSVANDLDVPFLGEIPFDATVVKEGDDGVPTMVARHESTTGAAFDRIAAGIAGALGWRRVEVR